MRGSVLVLGLLLAGCGGDNVEDAMEGQPTTEFDVPGDTGIRTGTPAAGDTVNLLPPVDTTGRDTIPR